MGRRGGGARFTRELYQEFSDEGLRPILILNKDLQNLNSFKVSREQLLTLSIPRISFIPFFNFISKRNFKKILNFLPKDSLIIVCMHHFDQLRINKNLKKNGFTIFNIVHDVVRHKGDYWPSNRFLKRYFASGDLALVLSNFVKSQLPPTVPSATISFPRPIHSNMKSGTRKTKDLLLIGRFKKYQNLKAFSPFLASLSKKYRIMVVGSGKIPKNLEKMNIELVDHWVSDEFIFQSMLSSRAIILPYSEASQSGWIPLALSFNLPVFATRVGGLPEQIRENVDGKTFETLDALHLFLKNDFSDISDSLFRPSFFQKFPRVIDYVNSFSKYSK